MNTIELKWYKYNEIAESVKMYLGLVRNYGGIMPYYIFPTLSDDKEFERMVVDCFKGLYPEASVSLYGRNGQKQYGIDIIVQSKEEVICVQCKNKTDITVKDVSEIIDKCIFIEKFPLRKLVIATASLNDTAINDFLLRVNSERNLQYDVEYLSWECICDYIVNFPYIHSKYYRGLQTNADPLSDEFFELLNKYQILAFLRIDPMIEGISVDTPTNIDCFVMEVRTKLDENAGCKDEMYMKIYEFMDCIDRYNGNLSTILFLDQNTYNRLIYLTPINGDDPYYREKRKMVLDCRNRLTDLYNLIVKG